MPVCCRAGLHMRPPEFVLPAPDRQAPDGPHTFQVEQPRGGGRVDPARIAGYAAVPVATNVSPAITKP
jgi:hypothetical protein